MNTSFTSYEGGRHDRKVNNQNIKSDKGHKDLQKIFWRHKNGGVMLVINWGGRCKEWGWLGRAVSGNLKVVNMQNQSQRKIKISTGRVVSLLSTGTNELNTN